MRTSPAIVLILTGQMMLSGQSVAEDKNVTAQVWSDNWFAMHVDGEKVMEDSVPITTERSFNAETRSLQISPSAQITIVAKDFKENDTGLEYIGSGRQQMGDGGFIAQLIDASGVPLWVSNEQARCLVLHHAPADPDCARQADPVAGEGECDFQITQEPEGWMSAEFDDSEWPFAIEYSEADVRPKSGYDDIRWDDSARLIWSENLTQDNTLICRLPVLE